MNHFLKKAAGVLETAERSLAAFFIAHPAKVVLLLNSLLFSLFFLCFTPVYQSNDDTAMNMIVSGLCLSPEPNAHLLYSHIFIGYFLKQLYSISSAIPWYGLYLFTAHFIALFFIAYALFEKEFHLFKLLFYLTLFCLAELFFLQQIQFTSTAFMLGISGTLTLYRGLESNSNLRYFIAFFLLMFAFLVRPSVGLIVLALSSPLFLHKFQLKKSAFIVFFSIVLGFISLQFINSFSYKQHTGWEDFYEWNRYKAALNDYQRASYESHPKVFKEAGWEEVDYQLFRRWFFADTSIYGTQRLKNIHQALPSPELRNPKIIRHYIQVMPPSQWILIGFSFLCLFFVVAKKRKWLFVIQALAILLSLFFLLYLKLPARISYPLISFTILTGILFLEKPFRNRKIPLFIFLFSLSFLSVKNHLKRNKKDQKEFQNSCQLMEKLNPQENQLFVAWTNASSFDNILQPLNENRKITERLNLIYYGGVSNTPIYNKQLEYFQIDNIHQALYQGEKENISILSSEEFLDLYQEFLTLHYDVLFDRTLILESKKPPLWLWKLKQNNL